MSNYETDDEQVQAIKDWWKSNGTALLSGILVVALSWGGWAYWKNNKIANATIASSTFEMLQISMEQNRFGEVAREALKLIADQPKSPYSAGSALLLAKFYVEKDDVDKAMEQLTWVATNAQDDSIKLIGFLRKANLQLQAGNFSEAEYSLVTANDLQLGLAEQANLDYAKASVFLAKGNLVKTAEFLTKVVENKEVSANLLALARLQLNDVAQ